MSIDLLEQAQQQLQFGLYEFALRSFDRVLESDSLSLTAWRGKAAALQKLNR